MRYLYIVLAYLLLPFAFGIILFRGLRDRGYWHGIGQRFGLGPALDGAGSLWVHAVSVGEVQASAALVRALRERYPGAPVVVTTVTPTGAQLARRLFGEGVHVRYVPYDLPGSVRRFFRRIRPRLAVIMETELWPNLYHACGKLGIPLVLASARISPRSVPRYRRLVPLFRATLAHGIVIAAQTPSDAERFISIGAEPGRTWVTGNIKFDFELPRGVAESGRRLRERYAGSRPVWVAGSTHEGEEQIVLEAHRRIRARIPDALLLLAPRHPNRFAAVAAILREQQVSFVTCSGGEPATGETEVVLIDTLGQLIEFYAASDVAFVGGSLTPVGGHNLLEPVALALPVLTGPHNFNSQETANLLIGAGAVRVVTGAAGLADQVCTWLTDPAERARAGRAGLQVLDENRGALQRLMALIEPLVAGI